MKLKNVILDLIGRDALKAILDDLEIWDVDRRSVADMAAAVSRSHRAAKETDQAVIAVGSYFPRRQCGRPKSYSEAKGFGKTGIV